MALIEPVKQDPANPARHKRYPAGLRFWHWINVLIISGSLLTVLINSTLLKTRGNAAFIQNESQKNGLVLTQSQARAIAHAQSDEVWSVHIYFGYALAAFFVFRLILIFSRPKKQRYFTQLKEAYRNYFKRRKNDDNPLHDFAVKVIYLGFYILLIIMVLTGLSLAFDEKLGIPPNIRHSIKDVHGFCMYLVLAFILVHITGVVLAERDRSQGIVSDMINGGRAKDEL